MSQAGALHYVCTYDEARALVRDAKKHWVTRCGCRDGRGGACERSKLEVCVYFEQPDAAARLSLRALPPGEAEKLLEYAAERMLVARPFRDEPGSARTAGICLCCDDCCGYFLDRSEVCDRGAKVEKTAMPFCTDCGECVPVCRFGARAMKGSQLEVTREACFGCGLCAEVCPEGCVQMVPR